MLVANIKTLYAQQKTYAGLNNSNLKKENLQAEKQGGKELQDWYMQYQGYLTSL